MGEHLGDGISGGAAVSRTEETRPLVQRRREPDDGPRTWRCAGASVAGSSHEKSLSPCQDAHRAEVIATVRGEILVLAVSDGAGSAARSEQGSRLACDVAIEEVQRWLANDPALEQASEDHLHRLFDRCAERIVARATVLEIAPRELACTLLLAVVGPSRALFAQLGDGAIVADHRGVLTAMTWPQHGEFANTTFFITDAGDRAELQTAIIEDDVTEVAAFTDGIELMTLQLAERRVHEPFFAPLLETVRSLKPSDREDADRSLGDFLTSPRVRQIADDDLTLVLASRRAPATVRSPVDEPNLRTGPSAPVGGDTPAAGSQSL